jgi:CO/xanthine dehydrogenase Mo-binding subunit
LTAGADFGTSVNPQACRGQDKGAVLQAYGQSLFEELRYDGAQPANATPLAYRVPLAGDLLPRVRVIRCRAWRLQTVQRQGDR